MQRRGKICLDAKERVSNCNAEHEVDQKIDLIGISRKEWREILKMRGMEDKSRGWEKMKESEGGSSLVRASVPAFASGRQKGEVIGDQKAEGGFARMIIIIITYDQEI